MLNAIENLTEIMDFLSGHFGALNAFISGQKRGTGDSPLIGAHADQPHHPPKRPILLH